MANPVPEKGKMLRVYYGVKFRDCWARVHHISKNGNVYVQRMTRYNGYTKPRRIHDTSYGWSIYNFGA